MGFCSGCLVGFCSGCFTGDAAAAGIRAVVDAVGFFLVGFCSGWFPGVAGGKSGWCDVDAPIGLGGRGGITSPNMGKNSGLVDAAPEPSATRLITKITRIFTEVSRTHALNGPVHHRPRLRQGLGTLVTASVSECHERLA